MFYHIFIKLYIYTIKIRDVTHLNIKWRAFPASSAPVLDSSSEQRRHLSQPAVSHYLRYPSERTFSDNCLGTQHTALSPAGSRMAADIAHQRSTRNDTSYVVAVFLELLEPI